MLLRSMPAVSMSNYSTCLINYHKIMSATNTTIQITLVSKSFQGAISSYNLPRVNTEIYGKYPFKLFGLKLFNKLTDEVALHLRRKEKSASECKECRATAS